MLWKAMPPEPFDAPDLTDSDVQAAYVTDALETGDPFLVVLALKEIGMVRGVPVVLDENPMLSEVLRAVEALGFRLRVER